MIPYFDIPQFPDALEAGFGNRNPNAPNKHVIAANDRQFELGWATTRSALVDGEWAPATWLYGSGGGTSRLFSQPSYQAGVVPDSIATTYGGPAMRVVPDVAALGDPTTGMLVGRSIGSARGHGDVEREYSPWLHWHLLLQLRASSRTVCQPVPAHPS